MASNLWFCSFVLVLVVAGREFKFVFVRGLLVPGEYGLGGNVGGTTVEEVDGIVKSASSLEVDLDDDGIAS